MVFEKNSVERAQLSMYKDMISGSASSRGVMFILLLFFAMVALSFALGYWYGFNSVECVSSCGLLP